MTHFPGLMIAAIALCAGFAGAQTPPDFSGTWEPVELSETAFSAAVQTVSHTATALTYGHASSGGGHKFVYKLDGSENHSTLMNIRSVAKVSVDGDKLTISRVDTYPDGRVRESTQVWSIDATGHLVIDSTDGLKGEKPVARRVVYKKKRILLK